MFPVDLCVRSRQHTSCITVDPRSPAPAPSTATSSANLADGQVARCKTWPSKTTVRCGSGATRSTAGVRAARSASVISLSPHLRAANSVWPPQLPFQILCGYPSTVKYSPPSSSRVSHPSACRSSRARSLHQCTHTRGGGNGSSDGTRTHPVKNSRCGRCNAISLRKLKPMQRHSNNHLQSNLDNRVVKALRGRPTASRCSQRAIPNADRRAGSVACKNLRSICAAMSSLK